MDVGNVERVSQRIVELDLVVLPRTTERKREAAAAFAQYGEGRLAGTNLTLGDCAAYALARRLSGLLVCETSAFGSLMDPFKELAASLR
ncbi:MAG: hypothetical protein C0465_17850 [Ralstonia sp.]|nr:hypothetical protein [Ralstonia sp.]